MSGMNKELCPSKFGVRSCGVTEDKRGKLFQQEDMIKAIEHILEDDEIVFDRLYQFLEHLRA